MIRDLQDKILKLKKERDVCILAHAYEAHEILEVADYTGDSFGLSVNAAKAPQKNLLLCRQLDRQYVSRPENQPCRW